MIRHNKLSRLEQHNWTYGLAFVFGLCYIFIFLFSIYFSISSIVFLIKNPNYNVMQPTVRFGKTVVWNHHVDDHINAADDADTLNIQH